MKEIKYCPVCGKNILSGQKVCGECGSDIPNVPANPNDIKLALSENKWSIIVVCLIVIGCFTIIFL